MKISNSYYGEKSKFELLEQIVNAHKNVIVFYDSLYDRSMIERFFENKDVNVNRFPFAELESDRSVYQIFQTQLFSTIHLQKNLWKKQERLFLKIKQEMHIFIISIKAVIF